MFALKCIDISLNLPLLPVQYLSVKRMQILIHRNSVNSVNIMKWSELHTLISNTADIFKTPFLTLIDPEYCATYSSANGKRGILLVKGKEIVEKLHPLYLTGSN